MRFCPQCGEERLRADDLSLRQMLRQFAKDTSSVDGKLMRSWRSLLTRPGQLTADHIKGQRRRFLTPLALFFIANAAFVAVQALTGTNVLSTPLESHLHSQDWSDLVRRMVEARLAHRHLTLEAYAPVFDRSILFNAKVLIILMALSFAAVPAIAFRNREHPTGAHIVFALHLYAFVLALLSLSVILAWLDLAVGGGGLQSRPVDKSLTLFNLAVCGSYLYLAIGRVYRSSGWNRCLSTALFTAALALLFVGYRFAIFLITFATT
jgi:hypothetical protein